MNKKKGKEREKKKEKKENGEPGGSNTKGLDTCTQIWPAMSSLPHRHLSQLWDVTAALEPGYDEQTKCIRAWGVFTAIR